MLHLIPIDPPLAAVVPTRFVPFVENLAYDSVSPTQITFFVVHTAYLTFSGWLFPKGGAREGQPLASPLRRARCTAPKWMARDL